ncbi:hypothetical protein [Methylobacterium oryzisoli]|uniref:hypothetical protein n=1 Tax=Methylobacterium oryzisoli TaxID=3385502 RepID=UPI003892BB8F
MARTNIDWAAIEAAWREGRSAAELARTFGLHPGTVRRRAGAGRWERAVPDAARRLAPTPPQPRAGGGRVVDGHRTVIEQGQALTLRLLGEALAASGQAGAAEALLAEASNDDPERRSALERLASLPKRSAALRDLATAARLWIALERQAWGLDGKGRDADTDAGRPGFDLDAALRLLDPEQREQLRRIAEVLAVGARDPAAGA